MGDDSWSLAAELVAEFLRRPARMSHLLERVPAGWDAGRRRACQSLLFGTVRHLRLLEKALDAHLKRRPRKEELWAALLVASRELMEHPERTPKVVHHAVSWIGARFGRAERGLANAVLRKVAAGLGPLLEFEVRTAADLAWRYSHPEWWIKRWVGQFGWEDTVALLRWNQEEADVFARWQSGPEPSEDLVPTPAADGFFRVRPGSWGRVKPLVDSGRLYVQNPAASLAPRQLARAVPDGRLLELCAAPGGKGLLLEAEAAAGVTEIVSVDLEGSRFERMVENYERYGTKRLRAVAGDVLRLEGESFAGQFEGVLLDAPCSNSGVLQHKVDARWRQSPKRLDELARLQRRLLEAASLAVKQGGALVYSTCSVDRGENEDLVAAFLEGEAGKLFQLEASELSLPWRDGRDGAGVFLLRRRVV